MTQTQARMRNPNEIAKCFDFPREDDNKIIERSGMSMQRGVSVQQRKLLASEGEKEHELLRDGG